MSRRTRPPGALPPYVQAIVVAAVFGVAVVALLVIPAIIRRATPVVAQQTPEPIASGFFRPTPEQWQTLGIAPVRLMAFPDVADTDGTIAAADDTTTQVFSPYTGRVTHVFVTTGDTVAKGAPLFAVQADELAQAQNDLATALQTLAAARVQLHVTQANRERLKKLLNVDGAARKDVEQSRADLATALTAVRNDETAVALVRSKLRVLGAGDETANALAAAGQPKTLKTSVVVPAPISGLVMQRSVGVGQNLESAANGASTALLTIADMSRVFFVAAAPETEIAQIHVGDPVAVHILAFPGRTFDARVAYIAPSVDANTHRIAVRAAVANPGGALKPGMFGTFSISTGPASREVGVPEQSVIIEGDTARVWITGPNKTLALRYIRTGKTVDGNVEVLGGLEPGDHVVTSGSVFIDRAALGGD
jgi:cobalt-zinc-cadmium efflux system membrane fusion protein